MKWNRDNGKLKSFIITLVIFILQNSALATELVLTTQQLEEKFRYFWPQEEPKYAIPLENPTPRNLTEAEKACSPWKVPSYFRFRKESYTRELEDFFKNAPRGIARFFEKNIFWVKKSEGTKEGAKYSHENGELIKTANVELPDTVICFAPENPIVSDVAPERPERKTKMAKETRWCRDAKVSATHWITYQTPGLQDLPVPPPKSYHFYLCSYDNVSRNNNITRCRTNYTYYRTGTLTERSTCQVLPGTDCFKNISDCSPEF